MPLQQFPYELITQVISNLNGKDVLSFTQCNSYFYKRGQEESFWQDLCNLNGIYYCHPDITWKQLYCSGKLSKMCPHISHAILKPSTLEEKKQLLWNSFSSVANGYDIALKNYILCLHPSCIYFGDLACHQHHDIMKHNIVLKLSTMHCLELWCNSCLKTIGFDGFATITHLGLKSERYVMDRVTRTLTSIPNLTNNNNNNSDNFTSCITQGRRNIEASIYKSQFRYPAMHIVDKSWYSSWLDFISGSSSVIPGVLTNEKLLRSDGSLDPKLSLGKDFELIGSLTRWYIERVYDVSGVVISSVGLDQIPEYCKLAHSIKIRQHMSQIADFPPAF